MQIQVDSAQIIILFAILFVTVGYLSPIVYASYAPSSHYIEVNRFTTQDVTTADDSHFICFDRDVARGNSGTVFTQLYLVDNDTDSRLEVDSRTMQRYFQQGEYAVETKMQLPNDLQAGTYKYILVVQMDLAQGRVEREFHFTSEPFTVTESATVANNTRKSFTC